jgi:FixJ family two-component response regulator
VGQHSSYVAVIDDDESMCQALSRLLRAAGYAVHPYCSAEAFLDAPDRADADFVVADIQLRGMSGFDLQERLKQEHDTAPIAFITAFDEPETRARAAASGCVIYLRKPFPGNQLLDALRAAVGPGERAK